MRKIESSELIINDDGGVFHLHIRPEQIAPKIILVGDPQRVEQVAAMLDTIECRVANREFNTVTGTKNGARISVVSTGIGTDNIDIVMTELDALVNVDFETRMVRENLTQLEIVRLGTCGTLQPDIEIGEMILSEMSIGFDSLLNFYDGRNAVCRNDIEESFLQYVGWGQQLVAPYFIESSEVLNARFRSFTVSGMTISAPGFYAPQGRYVRIKPSTPERFNDTLASFSFGDLRIMNYEMESSALAGLAKLMGHHATTICTVIAQRAAHKAQPDYKKLINNMIEKCLENFL